MGPKNTNLYEDIEILLPVKFRWILFKGFRGEVKIVSANQRPRRPYCFSDLPEKHKLCRGRWDLASCLRLRWAKNRQASDFSWDLASPLLSKVTLMSHFYLCITVPLEVSLTFLLISALKWLNNKIFIYTYLCPMVTSVGRPDIPPLIPVQTWHTQILPLFWTRF